MRSLRPFLVCGMLFTTGIARAQSNLVLFVSDPGDYIGQGLTYTTTNSADFTFSGTLPFVQASAFGYGFTFTGPGGSNLTVEAYTNATRWPFNGGNPGIDISGNGRGCNMECGTFQILEIHTNASGQVDHFWGVFSNQCECFFAPMGGEIRYNSQLAPPPPPPNTLRVPAEYSTIQAAINAAVSGDTVLVSPGIYLENISFVGKAITVESEAGPAATIIDGNNVGTVVSFNSGETSNSVFQGFTVRNGSADFGAGMTMAAASPIIVGNVFSNNAQGDGGYGAAIGGNLSSPLIVGNSFFLNSCDNQFLSGVISFINNSSPTIANNIIVNNPCRGINMTIPEGTVPSVINNTIVGNRVGVRVDARITTALQVYENNIITMNTTGLEIDFGAAGRYPTWNNNLVFANGSDYSGIPSQTGTNGNISADPQFVNPSQGDYHLQATSPSIDAGNNNAPGIPATDFDGNPRIVDGHGGGTAIIDQGAYEFAPATITIDCPTNIVTTSDPGACSATVNYPLPVATAGATIVCQPPSGSIFSVGSTPVLCTASNAGFGVVSCTFTVTVNDVTLPTITCPSNVTVSCASQVPPPDFAGGNVTDNCRGVIVSWGGDVTNSMTCPDRFTIQRTYVATDASSNVASCFQTITVNSTSAPTITCPGNVTASADTGKCSASGVVLGSVTAVGTCGDTPTVLNNAPSQFLTGTNAVIWTATDRCGNSSTCTQFVIVVDSQPPIITQCAPSMTASASANGQASVPVFTNAVVATDNCTPASALAITQNPIAGTLAGLGTNTITITVKDAVGNASQCATSFIVTQSVVQAGCQTTQDLIDRVNGLGLNQDQKDELLDILQDTHPRFGDRGRGNDRRLESFVQKVIQFKWTGLLDDATAHELINCAQSVLPRDRDRDDRD
jgi:hypothetical protein